MKLKEALRLRSILMLKDVLRGRPCIDFKLYMQVAELRRARECSKGLFDESELDRCNDWQLQTLVNG